MGEGTPDGRTILCRLLDHLKPGMVTRDVELVVDAMGSQMAYDLVDKIRIEMMIQNLEMLMKEFNEGNKADVPAQSPNVKDPLPNNVLSFQKPPQADDWN